MIVEYKCPEEQHRRLGNEDHGLRAAVIDARLQFSRESGIPVEKIGVTWGWGLIIDGFWVVDLVAYKKLE